ncbi:MAG: N-acetylglucosamine/diacetylchitobiose ABC transporter substrate-binding protein [Propionibacteriaceae bacterium]|nr:N-acetylglucosamine/diacetylchitobiose ABC transporter substrate-binding protein [Propionibacteriaceae bacterium]
MIHLISRRRIVAAAMAGTLALALVACAQPSPPPSTASSASAPGTDANNPFGVAPGSSVEVYGFDGGFGTEWLSFAAAAAQKNLSDVTFTVTPTTKLMTELQPRFVAKNPPDVIDNTGADAIPFASIIDQLETLDDLWAATNYDGDKISDAVFGGVDKAGTSDGKFIRLNYALTVFGLFHSKTLFEANGWEAPKTWDDLATLCTAAKAKDKYLFTFGKEAVSYYGWLVLDSAIKQGGIGVMNDIANLKPGAWSAPAVKDALTKLEALIKDGCMVPGGSGTQFTQAQAQFSQEQKALLYPSGSWLESEMKDATAPDFQMTITPFPLLDPATAAMPYEAIQASGAEPLSVTKDGANPAGGKEFLRAVLSKEAATNFSKTTGSLSVVKTAEIPADGWGSSQLASSMSAMSAAGSNVFAWIGDTYSIYYGIQDSVLWASFLDGSITAEKFIAGEEELSAAAAADTSITKMVYDYS